MQPRRLEGAKTIDVVPDESSTLRVFVVALLVIAAACAGSCGRAERSVGEQADLVLRGGRIVTLDDRFPRPRRSPCGADGLSPLERPPKSHRMSDASTEVIELHTRFAMPGFIEGHGHFTGIGENKMNLDLVRTTSWDEIVQAGRAGGRERQAGTVDCRARVASGEVDVRSRAERRRISPPRVARHVSPANPVVLTHASGHASFVNAKAMELSSISRTTANPNGGEIREGSARKSHRAPAGDGGRPGASRRRRADTDGRGGGSARRSVRSSSRTRKWCRRASPAFRMPARRSTSSIG